MDIWYNIVVLTLYIGVGITYQQGSELMALKKFAYRRLHTGAYNYRNNIRTSQDLLKTNKILEIIFINRSF